MRRRRTSLVLATSLWCPIAACSLALDFESGALCDGPDQCSPEYRCVAGRCRKIASTCGDYVVDAGETCDDGVYNGGYGHCAADCVSRAPHCGDGVVDAGIEECDDGDVISNGEGGCTADCSAMQTCGDGVKNGTEVCDDGDTISNGGGRCVADCSGIQTCGDGQQNGTEACDDGDRRSNGEGGCTADCSALQVCGDGVKNGTETCDDGDTISNAEGGCTADCSRIQTCGNGTIEGSEVCDDGDTISNGEGACTADCAAVQNCGDNAQDGTEACDDGNTISNGEGTCVADCSAMQTCGDGQRNGTEVCDDGDAISNGDGRCVADCSGIQTCGNGTIEGSEACDDGDVISNGEGGCRADCSGIQLCGDGEAEGNEECDEGPQQTVACEPTCRLRTTAQQVTVGTRSFACALLHDGSVKCWGAYPGNTGTSSSDDNVPPQTITGFRGRVAKISCGYGHCCTIQDDAGVMCWGDNHTMELGADTGGAASPVPLAVPGLPGRATDVVAAEAHSCAVMQSGAVACWGSNTWGQLGTGSGPGSAAPTVLSGLGAVQQLATGQRSTCALETDGDIACWGNDVSGALGNDSEFLDRASPVYVTGLLGPAVKIVAGSWHACALLAAGSVWCWGSAALGTGTGLMKSGVPVEVAAIGDNTTNLFAGLGHNTCAVRTDRSLWCWGGGWDGQLGVWPSVPYLADAPIEVQAFSGETTTSMSIGGRHACAVTELGKVVCWGHNEYGALGVARWEVVRSAPQPVVGLSDATAVIAGPYSTAAIGADGRLYSWGTMRPLVGGGSLVPAVWVEFPSNVTAFAGSRYSACAILADSTVVCWGSLLTSQTAGGGSFRFVPEPEIVAGVSATRISAGYDHACALTSAGAVVCWGSDGSGALGDGGQDESDGTPRTVVGLGSGVVDLTAGGSHTCALLDDTTVVCWGSDHSGQLGDGGADQDRGVPAPVAGLSGVVDLTAGGSHTCALLSTGGVECWGGDYYGQLGDGGQNADQGQPVPVAGLSGITAISAGGSSTCALLADGTVSCWGAVWGDEPAGSIVYTAQPTPTPVSGLSGPAQEVSVGSDHACVRLTDGTIECWGYTGDGKLGDGALTFGRISVKAQEVRSIP